MERTMPKAEHDSITIPAASPLRPARRAFLANTAYATVAALGAAGVLYAKAEAASPHPDAELVAIGHEAERLVAEYDRLMVRFFEVPDGDPAVNAISDEADIPFDRLNVLNDRALELKATTMEGAGTDETLRI
jgi:hypothetical protein